MSDAQSSKRASYEDARSAFERLDTQDKVAFVVEATFTTLGLAVEQAGRALAAVIEDLARKAEEAQPGTATEPPPAGPANGATHA